MHAKRLFFRLIPVLMIAALLAIPVGAQDGGGFITGEAIVSSIEFTFGDGETTSIVSVIVRGNLPDGCTRLQDMTQDIGETANTIVMTLTTTRPADAACTQSLVPFEETFAVNVSGLPAGTYTVVVNGIEASFRLTSEMVRSAIDLQGPEICANPEPELSTYINGYDGICFLFPRDHTVTTPEPGMTVITAPEDVIHTVRPTVTISVSEIEEQTTQDVVDAIAAENEGLDLVTSEINMQAQTAIVVENLPGEVMTRQVFVVRFGVLYHVTVQSTDPAVAGSDVAENLWTTVIDSLRFVAVDRDEAGDPIINGLFYMEVLDDLQLFVILPGEWILASEDGIYGIVPPESYGLDSGVFLVTFSIILGIPMDSVNNFGAGLQAYYTEQGETDFQLGQVVISFRNSVLVIGLEHSCLTAVVPTGAGAVSIDIQDAACTDEGILEDTVILNILNSVRVITDQP